MSQFSRQAPWLRQIFPTSSVPERTPGDVTETVHLIQPYDGGGFPGLISQSPESWFFTSPTITLVAAETSASLFTTSADQIHRLLSVACFMSVRTADTFIALSARSAAPDAFLISNEVNVTATGRFFRLTDVVPIVGPSMDIGIYSRNSTLNDTVFFRFFLRSVPLGTVFYL